jgi:hypothetical protein
MVTNEQLYFVIGIPMLSNAVFMGLGVAFLEIASERRVLLDARRNQIGGRH